MNDEKKYNEALERARKLYEQGTITESLCYVFPELKESEDERIRKELLEHCKNQAEPYILTGNNCPQIQSWIAWLEKQKVLTTEENLQGKEDVLWCIKQAKKHAKDENEMGTCWFAEKWLKKQGEQNPAWSEEDEKTIDEAVEKLERYAEYVQGGYSKQYVLDLASRVESLKERVQPKQKWSKEDKVMLGEIIDFFENGTVKLQHDLSLYASWLKSLRPQKQWKPSEEQIKALHDLNLTGNISYAGQGQVLIELYNDLKKLKG